MGSIKLPSKMTIAAKYPKICSRKEVITKHHHLDHIVLKMLSAPSLLTVHAWSDANVPEQGKYLAKPEGQNEKTPAQILVREPCLGAA